LGPGEHSAVKSGPEMPAYNIVVFGGDYCGPEVYTAPAFLP